VSRREGQRRLRVEHGKIVEHPPRPREITGKISHWGRVGNRTHILTAKVPTDFALGDTFLVKVLTVPDCGPDECDKAKEKKQ
jgi:hypothetical protein